MNSSSTSSGVRVRPADVEHIVALEHDYVLRNLLITQAYHDLSEDMARLLGRGNTNWCTFACWASRTAGDFVRGEVVSARLRALIESSDQLHAHKQTLHEQLAGLHPLAVVEHETEGVLGTAHRVLDDVSLYMREGNLTVFAEMGMVFARFIETFQHDVVPDRAKLEAFCAQLKEGRAEPDEITVTAEGTLRTSTCGGQTLLREMVRNYYAAMFEREHDRKAELILLANAQGGLHEQTRLQPYILRALDAPIDDLLNAAIRESLHGRVTEPGLRARVYAVLDRALHGLAQELRAVWRTFSTLELSRMKLPDGEMQLGRDVPAAHGKPLYPPDLVLLSHPQLCQILEHYDAYDPPDPLPHGFAASLSARVHEIEDHIAAGLGRIARSAAHDWSVFAQRVRYILDYFRSRQQDAHLFEQPFTEVQLDAMRAGRVPPGPLP